MSRGFPIRNSNYRDKDYFNVICGTRTRMNFANGATPSRATTAGTITWANGTPPAITANQMMPIGSGLVSSGAGRTTLVHRITALVSTDCEMVLSLNSGSNLSNTYTDIHRKMYNPAGGELVWDFTANPLRVNYNDTLSAYYARNAATGILYNIIVESTSISSDLNYAAPFELGIFGDSFCNVQGPNEVEYSNINGVETGTWHQLVQRYLFRNGIETVRTNIGQGGTNIGYWLQRAQHGLFRNWRPDIVLCNLGINDGKSTIENGSAESGLKQIIAEYFDNVPNGCFVQNNVADTDTAGKQTTLITTGAYSGKSEIVALREIVANVVSALKAANPSWDLHLADTTPANTYTSAQPENYVSGEQGAGNRLHPNLALGQPKIAAVVKNTVAVSTFFTANKV